MSTDSGPGNREVAYRLFAAEFEDSTVSYSESDEERAPNYVVTPSGGRVNRVFLVGVLTEVERVGGEQLRARVNDTTGTFVTYAGQYQPDELAFLDRVDPPAFLAITGKARTFEPDDGDRIYTSVRPESISEVDAATRDRWVVGTAEQTLDRVSTMASALRSGLRGEALRDRLVEAGVDPGLASGTSLAVEHYGTTSAYLQALRETALDAVRVVAGEREEVDRLDLAPGEGGSEDAVLAGLAGLDLDSSAGPDVASERPAAATDTGVASTEPTASTESEATEVSAESEPEPEAEPETDTGTAAEPEPVEATTEPEPEPESESERQTATPAAESGTDPGSGTSGSDTATSETDPDEADTDTTEPSTTPEPEPVGSEGSESPTADDEEFEDFEPGEFELPEEEREEIEAEFGTDFETAGEVGPAGEAGIETPEPEPTSESTVDSASGVDAPGTAEETSGADAGTESEPGPEPEPEPEPETPDEAGDVDVDEVTVGVIAELDDGDGADREAVVSTVADRYGVAPEEVEEAIDAAMMSGQAYEPSDGVLKSI